MNDSEQQKQSKARKTVMQYEWEKALQKMKEKQRETQSDFGLTNKTLKPSPYPQ